MAFQYERDDFHRQILVTFEGAFRMADVLASIERRRAENAWSYGVLCDVRRLEGLPNMAELRQLLREYLAIAPKGHVPGPMAAVAATSSLYVRACAFAALAPPGLSIQVFRDISEADAWLKARTRQRVPFQGMAS